ncbi:hypothetical protein [Streptomyces sp. NPDC057694]|uniref:hypothetical protein n=1 Tax=Streptomyces sp. NPDC057694 TaxID=3346216 RepID=UPI0036BF703B
MIVAIYVMGIEWFSAYDNNYIDDAHRLDIDHLVPLAEGSPFGGIAVVLVVHGGGKSAPWTAKSS